MDTKTTVKSKFLHNIDWKIVPPFIILLLSFKLYYLVPLPGSLGINANVILPMLACDSLLVLWAARDLSWLKQAYYGMYLLFLMFFLILEIFYTIFTYPDEPVLNAVKEFSTYTLLLSYFIFFKYACKNYNKFLSIIINSSSFLALLFLVQGVCYNLWGIKFLQFPGFSYGQLDLDFRNGNIRLVACDLISYASILSMGRLFDRISTKKQKKQAVINILLVFLYEGYVSQTRSMLLILGGVFFLETILAGVRKKRIQYLLILGAIAAMCLATPFLIRFFAEVMDSLINRTDWSVYHRFDSYVYYLKIIEERGTFGIGLLNDIPAISEYFSLVHGKGGFGYSDVGIIGVLGKLGVVGVMFYLFPIAVTCKRVILSFLYKKSDAMNIAIFLAMVFSIVNLSMFDAQRLIVLAIFMAVSDVSYIETKKRKLRFK